MKRMEYQSIWEEREKGGNIKSFLEFLSFQLIGQGRSGKRNLSDQHDKYLTKYGKSNKK
jgi:hypothetical protein